MIVYQMITPHVKGAPPPPRSYTKIFMVRIKIEVPMFLIVFDLLFQMQEKSRRSISKKVRIARFLIILK